MQATQKVSEILVAAAYSFKSGKYPCFQQSVSAWFWKSFAKDEQSQLMQDVYIMLCEMDFTPLECDQPY